MREDGTMVCGGLGEELDAQEFLGFVSRLVRISKGLDRGFLEVDLLVDREEFARAWRERCLSIGKGMRR